MEEPIRNAKQPRPSNVMSRLGDVRFLGTLSHIPVRCRNRSMTMYMKDVHTMNTKNAYLEKMNPSGMLGSRIPAPNTKKN